ASDHTLLRRFSHNELSSAVSESIWTCGADLSSPLIQNQSTKELPDHVAILNELFCHPVSGIFRVSSCMTMCFVVSSTVTSVLGATVPDNLIELVATLWPDSVTSNCPLEFTR